MLDLAQDTFTSLLQRGDLIPAIAIVGGLVVAIVAIFMGIMAGILKTRAREETKREIAAYVAEGSIDPDKAIAMLNAGEDADACCGGGPSKAARRAADAVIA